MLRSKFVHRLRSYSQLSWSVKIDIDDPLPPEYASPPDAEQQPEAGVVLEGDRPYRVWIPCNESTTKTIALGKKGEPI